MNIFIDRRGLDAHLLPSTRLNFFMWVSLITRQSEIAAVLSDRSKEDGNMLS